MQAQIVLLTAIGALACLGFTQGLRCYVCKYATGSYSKLPFPLEPKCADPFDSSIKSLDKSQFIQMLKEQKERHNRTFPGFPGFPGFPERPQAPSFDEMTQQAEQTFAALLQYCYKGKLTTEKGTVVERGFHPGGSLGCKDVDQHRECFCDTSECNSASCRDGSFGLIAAVALIAKLVCRAAIS